MTDEELGFEIWKRASTGGHASNMHKTIGRAARELLAKPVTTREEVEAYLTKRDGYVPPMDRVASHLAAISHFVPPRQRMMIEGMAVSEIVAKMREGDPNETFAHCARVAHRLATTPAPEVDPDAEAKRLAFAYLKNTELVGFWTAGQHWGDLTEIKRNGWRAVASAKKEAGGE